LPSPIVSDLLAFGAIFTGMIMFHWHEDPDVEATTISAEDKEAASLLNDDDDYGLRYM
jgi:hypothetical protein